MINEFGTVGTYIARIIAGFSFLLFIVMLIDMIVDEINKMKNK